MSRHRSAPLPALFLALAAGLAQAASLAVPGSGAALWWLQILSLAVLYGLLDRSAGAASAAGRAIVFATAWLAATFWWLFISMHTYGGLSAPLAVLAVLGLAAFLGLDYALLGAAWRRFAPRNGIGRALLFAACWLLAELLRGTLYTGFPWGAGGYAHVDGPLAGYAPWLGVYGIGFLAAFAASALAQLVRGRFAALPVAGIVLAAGAWGHLPALATRDAGSSGEFSVALLQGNIPQDEKFQPGTGVPVALQWYGERLRDAKASLVVAPETAIPLLPQQLPAGYWDGLLRRYTADVSGYGLQAAIIGLPLGSSSLGYTNSVVGLKPQADAVYRYDKHHLVPFGEFIPPGFRWFTEMMNIPLGDFNRGPVGAASFAWGRQRLAPNICYEDLFGEELAARFADAHGAPTAFVNVSNIGWFGTGVAIDQHLHISRMRALEFARPMIRATNTGATAVIDHHGAVVHSLPRATRAVLEGTVEGRTGTTPFAAWASRFGLAPLWGLGIVVLAVAVVRRRAAR
ncbi:apolipoprotein N-acyltransferase [Xylophilus sp.]|uniref:apolipoprotein N-acyltransferase n=1 Tax=Xylophilus sp. TaxID=2653893 RepID=UPI0013BE688D|nr:apolipoprotein N-acyltransferase [Xylophilus sp.]KAF1046197.1 MAG: Apolipoprotein N-acyltransferase [Xylophilus sp.]